MLVGCPTEVKTREYRVGILPATVQALKASGHDVIVQKGAGEGAGIHDDEVWKRAEMICKVKEPIEQEFELMQEGQTLFTYLHLAPEPVLTKVLLDKKITGVAYETIEVNGLLPLLKPMSEVAGKMATQVGAMCLAKELGGKGVLLGGTPGVPRGRVVVIGGGVVGVNAAKIAVGMGAEVTILDNNLDRLEYLDDVFLGRVQTLYSAPHNVAEMMAEADLVVGAVLVRGARAPMLVTREHVKSMEEGSVIVDVAVDQGGCCETSRVTTHDEPTFIEEGVVHYGVANMPGAVARTSTYALNHATLPFCLQLANKGPVQAAKDNDGLALGFNTYAGKCTYEAVAEAHDLDYTPIASLF
jgi:alanine dehydrogenase